MPEPNDALEALVRALDLAMAGDWEGAHRIVQEREDDAFANWIHAVVHRMEGDRENASYWYERCGRSMREDSSTAAELREIREAVSAMKPRASESAPSSETTTRES